MSLAVGAAISVGLILVAEAALTRPIGAISALATTGTVVILGHAFILWPLYTPDNGSLRDFVLALTAPWVVGFVAWWTRFPPLCSASLVAPAPCTSAGVRALRRPHP